MTGENIQRRIASLQEEITDLKKRFPAHSLKPAMFQQLEELEEELSQLLLEQERSSPMPELEFAYPVPTDKSFADAVQAVEEKCAANNMRVQHIHDVQATLAGKGYQIEPLKIIEICDAPHAYQVLSRDKMISLMMPCKINVLVKDGQTYISALRPTILARFFPHADLAEVAAEVDTIICRIVDTAR